MTSSITLLALLTSLAISFGVNASQVSHDWVVQTGAFNKGWTNIITVENKGVGVKIQQYGNFGNCRTVRSEKHKVTVVRYKTTCQEVFDNLSRKRAR